MIENKYGIIGKPLSHSLSPLLHNFWFKKYNIKASYTLLEIEADQIEEVLNKIKKRELKGINVTTPYKQAVIPFLDLVINDSKKTSSVNTIYLNSENKIVGENTDVYGFDCSFIKKLEDKNLVEKSFFIVGAGGVAPSVIYDIIINATSLGMKNGKDFNEAIKKFKPGVVYYDVIYNPLETTMLKNFKEKKVKTFNGLEMFLYQGQKSFYLWNKISPEIDEDLKKIIISNLR